MASYLAFRIIGYENALMRLMFKFFIGEKKKKGQLFFT